MHDQSEGPIILAAFANDRSDAANFLRNLSVEAQRMQAVLEPARPLCPLVLLAHATLDEILNAFQKYRDRVVVFHYAGHANGFELLLESATGGVHRIGAQGLASFLGQQQGLQLVFLNGCSTEGQAEDLLNAGVGCVIATTQSIDDGVATEFSVRFYKGIVTGAPLQSAYAEATGSAQAASGGSIDRLIRRKEEQAEPHVASRWPWLLKFKPGAERVAQWSLPEAAGDPLFGLPPVAQRALPESPYRHLNRFEAEHAEVFFGRGHEIRELYQRVTASDAAPVVLFYGPSGVGKSSLLDAGLIPRLTGKHEVRFIRRDPARGLGETLRSAFPKAVRQLSRRDAWIATEKQLGRPLVIVLDQVEEVFTKPNASQPHELAEFSQLLRRIFYTPDHRPQGKLILGFRKEWFAEIDEMLADAQVPRSRIFLDRLSRRGAIEAITGPVDDLRLANQYKLKVEDGLPDLIADDLLADPDTPVAPTLQILLTRMWSEACRINREQPTFDTKLYQSLHRNGILLDDFLRQQTELIHAKLPRAVDSGFLLDLLEFHTTAIGTSAEHPLSVLEAIYSEQTKSGLLSQTLEMCEVLYLLTFSRAADEGLGRSSRLLHDTLAPLIRARHEESDLPGQRSRRILDNRIVDWLDGKTGIPLDSKDLKEVEAALEGTRSWSVDEQQLVQASREQRSSNRRWSRIFQGLGLAAVLLIGVSSGFAYLFRGDAESKAIELRKTIADLKKTNDEKQEAERKRDQASADAGVERQKVEAAKIEVGRLTELTATKSSELAAKETELSTRTKELETQNARIVKAKQEADAETARNQTRMAVSARDIDHDHLRSSHLFASAAASAFAANNIELNTTLRFAAGRSIAGVRMLDTLEHEDSVHEAWLLKAGQLLTWSGSLTTTRLKCWNEEGVVYDIPFDQSCRRVVLSPDETQLYAEFSGTESSRVKAFDPQTGDAEEVPSDLSLDLLPLPVLFRSDVNEILTAKGFAFLMDVVPHIYGVSFSADETKVLLWTAKSVAFPNGFVGVVDNPSGMVQVWDTRAQAPLTPPLKLTLPLRGAKFINGDREFLMWGEDGRVRRWKLADPGSIKTVTRREKAPDNPDWPREITFQIPAPLSRRPPSRADIQREPTSPPRIEKALHVTWNDQGWAFQGSKSYPLPGLYGMQFSPIGQLLGWGGSTGAPGTGSGGFVVLLSARGEQSRRLLQLPHRSAVASACFNREGTRILTSTWVSEPGNPKPASVHLWDRELGIEVMPAIPNFNNMALHAEYGPDDHTLIIHSHTVRQQPEDKIEYLTYELDITPEAFPDKEDPRIDLVRRTGTFLNRNEELEYLPRDLWKVICIEDPTEQQVNQRGQMKAFEDWTEAFYPDSNQVPSGKE